MSDALPPDIAPTRDELLARPARFSLARAFGEGWGAICENYLPILGASLVGLALHVAMRIADEILSQMIDYGTENDDMVLTAVALIMLLGLMLITFCLLGPIFGGMYTFILRVKRGENPAFSRCFDGFGSPLKSLAAAGLTYGFILVTATFLALLPSVILWIILISSDHPNLPLTVSASVLTVLGVLPAIYLAFSYNFAYMLILDKGLGFWDGLEVSRRMITRNWFKFAFAFLLIAGVGLFGVFLCVLPGLFTMPLSFAIFVSIYDQVFGEA